MANSPSRFRLTQSVLTAGVASRAFPAAAIEVGRTAGPLWQEAFGRVTYDSDAEPVTADTRFDLASLTKVIATTSLCMRLAAANRLDLEAPIRTIWPDWNTPSRAAITVRHLLDHSSGFPAHARLWEDRRSRAEYLEALREIPLDQAPGTSAVYSDLGFIALGFLLEELAGPLSIQVADLAADLGMRTIAFGPVPDSATVAPTEFDPWRGRLLRGEVHDENAAALGGHAGHAGLFGTVGDVGTFARMVLATFTRETQLGQPALARAFATRSEVSGSSRALGWDTMLPTSSCGTRLSTEAIGHTGFTGTSLWIDPALDLYVVLLTNRVYPTRANNAIRAIRPRVHDAIVEDLTG